MPQKSSDYNFECLNSEFGWQGRVYWKHNNFAIHLGISFSWWSWCEKFQRPPNCWFRFSKIFDRWKMSQDKYFEINILFPQAKHEKKDEVLKITLWPSFWLFFKKWPPKCRSKQNQITGFSGWNLSFHQKWLLVID